jgi:hypothetical protein
LNVLVVCTEINRGLGEISVDSNLDRNKSIGARRLLGNKFNFTRGYGNPYGQYDRREGYLKLCERDEKGKGTIDTDAMNRTVAKGNLQYYQKEYACL